MHPSRATGVGNLIHSLTLHRTLWRMVGLVLLLVSECWRALAKGTAWVGFYCAILLLLTNHRSRTTLHDTRARRRESRSTHATAAAAAATEQHHARARRPARRAHRARSHSTAAGSSAAELQAPDTTHERRRTTTKRCCVPTRAQSRRRRSMGNAKTGVSPWQRGPVAVARAGGFLFPLMRAWLEQPHGRRHKAPPPPCALTT